MIQGGWGYIIASYTITWVVLGLYFVSLFVRANKTNQERDRT
ncbi:MAG: CcmD family protein [Deltaproteobacteria bacterium]|nr:CcmD family protein [Deltaproteobacteria bacterium]